MSDNIIEIKKLPSGATAIISETSGDTVGIEVGSNCIFIESSDIFDFIRLVKAADKHFLRQES